MRNHNGWYQGIVESSADPKKQRRVTAQVPDVLGKTISQWARPVSIVDAPLKKGDQVWVNFPNGDSRYPTYTVANDPKWGRIVPTKDRLDVLGPDSETSLELGKTQAHLLGPGGGSGALLTGDLHAKGTGGYTNVYAVDFIKTSDRSRKTDIQPLDFDPVRAVMNAPPYTYRYLENDHAAVGPMREDLPGITHVGDVHVSEGSLVGILWAAVHQLASRVEQLEQKVATLTENGLDNTLDGETS